MSTTTTAGRVERIYHRVDTITPLSHLLLFIEPDYVVVEAQPYSYTPRSRTWHVISWQKPFFQNIQNMEGLYLQMWQEKPQWTWCKNHGLPGFIFSLTSPKCLSKIVTSINLLAKVPTSPKCFEKVQDWHFHFALTPPNCLAKAHEWNSQDNEAQFGEWPHICAVLKWVHAL